MLGLPKSTEFNQRIPKRKFYEHFTVSQDLKQVFTEQIKSIQWCNKIAPTTVNLAAGKTVTEIEVFEVRLSVPQPNEAVLRQIDKGLPYHILFVLEYEGRYQAWIAYKEAAGSGSNAFKVGTYYHTEWMEESALPLRLDGLTTDNVYENFVRQIAGETLPGVDESLKESVERDKRRKALQKRIAAMEVKVRREKQFNKQVALNGELKKLKKELEKIK